MSPMAVSLDENGEATISVADIDGGSSDNCGIEDISLNITDFNCTHIGSNTVTMTVTDINGNVSTCTSEVVVVDDLAPEAECNDLSINLNEFGNATITVDDIDNGSTDNCAIVSMTIDQDFFDCEDIGDNTVTLTVTDTYGNTSTCTSTVTVSDVSAPTFVNCPTEMIMIGNDPDQCSGKLNWSIPVATDNCE
jgi:PKD repeat protein